MDRWISKYIIRYAIINYIAGTSQIYITKLYSILRDIRYICRAGKRSSLQDFLDYFSPICFSYNPFFFSVGIVFFSHNKSAGTIFRFIFLTKRTGPLYKKDFLDYNMSNTATLIYRCIPCVTNGIPRA